MNIKKMFLLALSAMFCIGSFASCAKTEPDVSSSPSSPEESEVSSEVSAPKPEMPEYWGYNGYENFVNPNAPEDIKEYPTKLTKVSDKKYSMQCETEAGLMTVTLEQRPWGMFNLWAWNLVDKNNKTHTFLVGATDLEYVFRTVTPEGKTIFSGGNHGSEALLSLEMYNGITEEKIDLKVGESVEVDKLHIIEKSKLMWIPDNNGDSISDYDGVNITEYTDDDVYAEITRKYTITGPQVKLNADFTYVKDTTHYYSYHAMFPINKKYGLWCDMIDREGNLIKTIETLKVGAGDYSGPQYSGNAATRVVLYGHEDPRYQFDVRINTPTDSLGNSENEFKTSIWDMNTTDNKVYFSKYNTNTPTTVKAGTEVHTETVWLFKYVEDATLPEGSEATKPFEEFVSDGELVSGGKNYTISGNGVGYGVYTANLTDGKTVNGLTYDGNWFGFLNGDENNTVSGVGSVIIDLEEKMDVSAVRVHVCNGGESGIAAPQSIKVSVSDDGNTFAEIGDIPVNEVSNAVYWSGKEISDVSARYVKVDFKVNGAFVFLNEIEVYSK